MAPCSRVCSRSAHGLCHCGSVRSSGRLSAAVPTLQISNETAPPAAAIKDLRGETYGDCKRASGPQSTASGVRKRCKRRPIWRQRRRDRLATVTWPQIDVQFSPHCQEIMCQPPRCGVSFPVLSPRGRTVVVSATSPDSSVSVVSGSVTVEGSLSVQKIRLEWRRACRNHCSYLCAVFTPRQREHGCVEITSPDSCHRFRSM